MTLEAPKAGIDCDEAIDGLLNRTKESAKVMLIGYPVDDLRKIAEKASQIKANMAGMGEFAVVNPGLYTPIIEACHELIRENA